MYIPLAQMWVVDVTRSGLYGGDSFFMKQFFKQNADLIADSDVLRPYFADQLQDKEIAVDAYSKFAQALESGEMPRCGVIVDDDTGRSLTFYANYLHLKHGEVLLAGQDVKFDIESDRRSGKAPLFQEPAPLTPGDKPVAICW